MEQNARNFGVIFATLALVASVLVMPNVSADHGGDLHVSVSGDDGITSYASSYGHASFTAEITSDAANTNVVLSASFAEGSGWVADQASFTDCSDDAEGTSTYEAGDMGSGDTLTLCIIVSASESNAEPGDDAEMTVSISSDEDTDGFSTNVRIAIADWIAYSDDGVQNYAENATNTYTITVQNIKVNMDGEGVNLEEDVFVSLSNAGEGWNIDSDNNAWDKMELKATISYIPAGNSFDLELDIQLVGGIVPASSYINSNSNIVFSANDNSGVYQLVTLEANVADNFALSSTGSGNEYVDNGCDADDTASLGWTPSIKNFGNTLDSFSVTFDTSDADNAGWQVDDADNFNTGNLLPKFEGGSFGFNVGLHVPGGLAAGTSHGFSMTITSDSDSSQTQTQTFSATVNQCYGMTLAVDKNSDTADPGASVDFTVTVTNDGNGEDTMEYQTMGAAEWAPSLSESSATITSGESAQIVFTLTVPSDASANAQSGMAMVHVYSEACGDDKMGCDYEEHVSVSVRANQVYDITAGYYTNETDVVKDSASVQEGMAVQMKFTLKNNGNGGDRVALSLVAAPSWITLHSEYSLLASHGTLIALIDIIPPTSGSAGIHTFQILATSADGTATSTTDIFTVTVVEKSTSTSGPSTEEVDEDDSPGFGVLSAVAALGVVLLLRRRS